MKDLRGEASQRVQAPPQRCLDLLADLESYPRWYPEVVRRIEVVQRDGDRVTRARATLHAAIGPINRDFELLLSVTRGTDTVTLGREPHERSDREHFEVKWRAIAAGADHTRLELALAASLNLPRMLPTRGLGDTLAAGFVGAAVKELTGAPT